MKTVNPDLMIHPYRNQMNDNDWERMNRIIAEKSDEDCTFEEIDAYNDYLYDLIAGKLQTVYGTTVLQ